MNFVKCTLGAVMLVMAWVPRAADGSQKLSQVLAGSWQSANKSNTVTFHRDGTGTNANGSRFRWRLEKNHLLVRAVAANGKVGLESGTPIEFTFDQKQYALVFEGGKLRAQFYRLTPSGVRFAQRTKHGRRYPEAAKPLNADDSTDSDSPVPTSFPGKPTSGHRDLPQTPSNLYLIGPNVQVSNAKWNVMHSEVVIAADPATGNRLAAASMFGSQSVSKIAIYTSEDYGKSWGLSFQRNGKDPESSADPAFAVRSDGTIYFVNMFFEDFGSENGRSLQFLARPAAGRSWNAGRPVAGLHDRPFLAIDNTAGGYRGRVYCVSQNGLFVSTDGGEKFIQTSPFSAKPGFHYAGPGNPVILSDGSLVTIQDSWSEGNGNIAAQSLRRKDLDNDEVLERNEFVGGNAFFGARKHETELSGGENGLLTARRSTNGGQTLSEEHEIARYDFNRLSYTNVPMMVADAKDRLFAVWNDALPAGGTGVFLSHSDDKGTTWSHPILLSEQSPQLFRDEIKWQTMAKYSAYMPCIATSSAGIIGVSWYDNRDVPLDKAGWDYRFRSSSDGGETWSPSARVSEKTTLFSMKRHKKIPLEEQRAHYHAGHTAGLCCDSNGRFHALWIDARTGVRQVWTATIGVRTTN